MLGTLHYKAAPLTARIMIPNQELKRPCSRAIVSNNNSDNADWSVDNSAPGIVGGQKINPERLYHPYSFLTGQAVVWHTGIAMATYYRKHL